MSVDIDAARARLHAERARVAAEVQALQDDLSHSIEDSMDEDGNDSHLADSATETRRPRDRAVARGQCRASAGQYRGRARPYRGRQLRPLRTLRRRPIAEDRLEALPYATKCIECKRLEERG